MRAIASWQTRGRRGGPRHKALFWAGKTLGAGTYGSVHEGVAFWRGRRYGVAVKRFNDGPDARSWCRAARAGVYASGGPVVPSLMVRVGRADGGYTYMVLMPKVPVAKAGHRTLPDFRSLGPTWREQVAKEVLEIPARLRRFPGPAHASHVDLCPANIGLHRGRVVAIDPDSVVFANCGAGWFGTYGPWPARPAPPPGATPRQVAAFDAALSAWVDDDRRQLMLTQWAAFATAAAVVSPEFGRGELATPALVWRYRERLAGVVARVTAKPGLPRWLALFEKQWALEMRALDVCVAAQQ